MFRRFSMVWAICGRALLMQLQCSTWQQAALNPVSVPWQRPSLVVAPLEGNEIHQNHSVHVWKIVVTCPRFVVLNFFLQGTSIVLDHRLLNSSISWMIPVGWIPFAWEKWITFCTSPFVYFNSTVAIVQLRLRRMFVCTSEDDCHLVAAIMY